VIFSVILKVIISNLSHEEILHSLDNPEQLSAGEVNNFNGRPQKPNRWFSEGKQGDGSLASFNFVGKQKNRPLDRPLDHQFTICCSL
jgi:hypothetical protein